MSKVLLLYEALLGGPSSLLNSCEKGYTSGISVLQTLFPKRDSGRWGATAEHTLLVADRREVAIYASPSAAGASRGVQQDARWR
jgi:hypothetical protein